jgi:hypothetical protein
MEQARMDAGIVAAEGPCPEELPCRLVITASDVLRISAADRLKALDVHPGLKPRRVAPPLPSYSRHGCSVLT